MSASVIFAAKIKKLLNDKKNKKNPHIYKIIVIRSFPNSRNEVSLLHSIVKPRASEAYEHAGDVERVKVGKTNFKSNSLRRNDAITLLNMHLTTTANKQ
jgi:hypothetical protein